MRDGEILIFSPVFPMISTMKTMFQGGLNGRVPVPSEKRFLIHQTRLADGWRPVECLHGAARADGRDVLLDLAPCDGAILRVGGGGEGRS